MFLLGPLKSRLHDDMGTSNTQFSLLIAAYKSAQIWRRILSQLIPNQLELYVDASRCRAPREQVRHSFQVIVTSVGAN